MSATKIDQNKRGLGKTAMNGFTLIELLIVVAIIAILAAIAVPNFLEAQTRAKASRVKADLRTVATGLEAYRVDNNDYPPNDGLFNVLPIFITTPVAYLGSTQLLDPFTDKELDPVYGNLAQFYSYQKILNCESISILTDCQEFMEAVAGGVPAPVEAVDSPVFNDGAIQKYGPWRMISNGPDRVYSDSTTFSADAPLYGSDIIYDPTNGTTSWGNILRTQKSSEGVIRE